MPFKAVEKEKPKEEGFVESIPRHAARTATNIGAVVGGLPGDLYRLAGTVSDYLDKFTPEKKGFAKTLSNTGKSLRKGIESIIPGSQETKQTVSELSGGYTDPKNKVESFIDEVIEDATSLALPGGGPTSAARTGSRIARRVARAGAISSGANLASEGVYSITKNEKAKNATKIGAMGILSLIKPRLARNAYRDAYRNAENLVPQGQTISATGLNQMLDDLEHSISRGSPRESMSRAKRNVLEKIDQVRSLDRGGQYELNQLIEHKRDLNESLSGLYHEFGTAEATGIQTRARQITNSVNRSIASYAPINPQWANQYYAAEEMYGAFRGSQAISRGAGRLIKRHGKVAALPSAYGVYLTGVPGAVTVGGLLAAHETGKILYKIYRSPHLRTLYARSLRDIAIENAQSFQRNYKKLDVSLDKELKKTRYKRVSPSENRN